MVGVVGQRQLDADIRQQLRVHGRDRAARLEDPVELLDLTDPERGREVVEAVVVTEAPVLEPRRRLEPPLVPQRDEQLVLVGRAGRDRPALAGRHLLVGVERPHRRVPVRAQRATLVLRAQGLARILDEREAVALAQLEQRVELARIPEDVDADDRLRARRDRSLDGRRVEVERAADRCRRRSASRPRRSRSSPTRRTSTAT